MDHPFIKGSMPCTESSSCLWWCTVNAVGSTDYRNHRYTDHAQFVTI